MLQFRVFRTRPFRAHFSLKCVLLPAPAFASAWPLEATARGFTWPVAMEEMSTSSILRTIPICKACRFLPAPARRFLPATSRRPESSVHDCRSLGIERSSEFSGIRKRYRESLFNLGTKGARRSDFRSASRCADTRRPLSNPYHSCADKYPAA